MYRPAVMGVRVLQPNEVVNLALALFLAPMCFRAVRRADVPASARFYAAFVAMLCAYVLTIAEAFVLTDVLNFLEHLSLAVAGILFVRAMLAVRTSTSEAHR